MSSSYQKVLIFLKSCFAVFALVVLFLPVNGFAQSGSLIPSKDVICGGSCPLIDTDFSFTRDGIANFILSIARFLTYIGGALSVLFIVYGAFLILIDFGSGKRAEAGWNCIKTSIIGLVIIIVAYTVVAVIGNLLLTTSIDSFITG